MAANQNNNARAGISPIGRYLANGLALGIGLGIAVSLYIPRKHRHEISDSTIERLKAIFGPLVFDDGAKQTDDSKSSSVAPVPVSVAAPPAPVAPGHTIPIRCNVVNDAFYNCVRLFDSGAQKNCKLFADLVQECEKNNGA